jgi:hypothetical protein
MREQPLDTYHHVVMRGSRDLNIVHDEADRWNFVRLLYYMNDGNYIRNWERSLSDSQSDVFEWPSRWPVREPLTTILCFCLHDNHFHLLLKQSKENGISRFMQRLPNAITRRYNKKYGGQGSIFQSRYRSRRIESDADMQNVALYIMIKNVFERFPNGLRAACTHFEDAYAWALSDPFSSFPDYAGKRRSPVIEKDLLEDAFPSPNHFKKSAYDYVVWRIEREDAMQDLLLE